MAADSRIDARQIGESLEMQNRCAELKLRAERKAGELLREVLPEKGNRFTGDTLSPLGIEKHQSSRWQRIADIPEDTFETHVRSICEAGKELTQSAMLKIAKSIQQQARDSGLKDTPVTEILDSLIGNGQTFEENVREICGAGGRRAVARREREEVDPAGTGRNVRGQSGVHFRLA